MSDYVKATDFASKDALLSGNPSKIIKGTEIDTEYNAIAVAIQTKADLVSPTFTGTPSAPTAAGGTNTTQVATTAFVTAAVTAAVSAAKEALYPVGSIYTNATNNTNPGTLLGFGTWTSFGSGRVMVGFNASDPLFDTAEETGGSKDAVLVSHTHTATASPHTHRINSNTNSDANAWGIAPGSGYTVAGVGGIVNGGSGTYVTNDTAGNQVVENTTVSVSNSTEGSSRTNANLQPYITVYLWKRTA